MRCTSPLYMVNRGDFVPPFIKNKFYNQYDYEYFVKQTGVDPSLFTRINCGQCIACRVNHAREWAERCYLEYNEHESSYFITLTYDDEHLIYNNGVATLSKRDIQLFIKRVRKWCESVGKPSPRYFCCGEYGEQFFRPHYHCILFNIEFDDLLFYKRVKRGNDIYTYLNSPTLEKLWGKGYVVLAQVCPETCSYTAQYSLKKVGVKYSEGYARELLESETATDSEKFTALWSLGDIQRPFNLQSMGIGGAFCKKNIEEILQTDRIPGCKIHNIRYFDKLLEKVNPGRVAELKELRAQNCDLKYNESVAQNEINARAFKRKYKRKESL